MVQIIQFSWQKRKPKEVHTIITQILTAICSRFATANLFYH